MSTYTFNPQASRVIKAKFAHHLPDQLIRLAQITAVLLLLAGLGLVAIGRHPGLTLIGLAASLITLLIWIARDLQRLPAAAIGTTTALDQLLPAELVAAYHPNQTASQLWATLAATPAANFLLTRFGLDPAAVATAAETWQPQPDQPWIQAQTIAHNLKLTTLNSELILAALFQLNPALGQLLTAAKLTPDNLVEGAFWFSRLQDYAHRAKPLYGGIARDWASGFTPLLSRFGTNLSQQIEIARGNLATSERTTQLDALVAGLSNATGSVILIGEPGIGKTALLLGLAERLLQGQASGNLTHHQIISLSASSILASTQGPGDLEAIVLDLLSEAMSAHNIIIALDQAELFFGQGPGAVNLSQILLPVLQARNLKLVLAVTPGDWQRLRATNAAMASLLTPLVLAEPDQTTTLRVLADHAPLLENGQLITTWPALLEAYRLSGRYLQDEAYPGRAIKLLEASLNYADGPFITATSVQRAVESQFGVKVQATSATESDVLLHLEDHIHQRMINQTHAVGVVANALRRARAGVANPRRPIGSFLFLGPTGVGKTELAKSLAALYFGAESNIIRLDMSEYQQVADVDRILESAAQNPSALLPKIRANPFSVVLFDEIEKAHPNILGLFLQLLDEGNLTDQSAHPASFKDAIIIATSNAGADEIRRRIEAGQTLESFEDQFTNDLIDAGIFKPELLNRFDEIVLFRPLNQAELGQVVQLMLAEINRTLQPQQITVALEPDAIAALVAVGYDPRLGARPMRRMVTRQVEDTIAAMILAGGAKPGDTITLDASHLGQR